MKRSDYEVQYVRNKLVSKLQFNFRKATLMISYLKSFPLVALKEDGEYEWVGLVNTDRAFVHMKNDHKMIDRIFRDLYDLISTKAEKRLYVFTGPLKKSQFNKPDIPYLEKNEVRYPVFLYN